MTPTKQTKQLNHIVCPAKSSTETRWLLGITLFTLVICATAISMPHSGSKTKQVEAWQLNAFAELNGNEIGVFNGLQTAALEIAETHELEDDHWMDVAELEKLYIPPFVKDAAWHKQGEILWSMKKLNSDKRHIALYKGTPAKDIVRGDILLLMLHDHQKKQGNAASGPTHAPFEIWFHDKTNQKYPEIITDQALISSGWREAVALTGEDEVTRMKGTSIQ